MVLRALHEVKEMVEQAVLAEEHDESLTKDEEREIIIVRDIENKPEWKEIQLGPDKWAMVRVGGETIVRRADKQLGDLEFEIQRLRANGDFESDVQDSPVSIPSKELDA